MPAMAIARWDPTSLAGADLGLVAYRLTAAAVHLLGGMRRFVRPNDTVWIKPNIGWNRAPELAANTNPDVVAALVALCLDAGAKRVKVGDNCGSPARRTYKISGIAAAARAAGAEVIRIDDGDFREVDLAGELLGKWPMAAEIADADLVINAAVVKHHDIAGVTACMKNAMGIFGGRRNDWHKDLATALCDAGAFLKPRLCVLDAVRVLLRHGPESGSPEDVELRGLVAAGTDIVALDALGDELLGQRAEGQALLRAAQDRGLGVIDYRSLALRETTLD